MSTTSLLMSSLCKSYNLQIIGIEVIQDAVKKIFRIKTKDTNFILKLFGVDDHHASQIIYERKLMFHLIANKVNCIEPMNSISKNESIYLYDNQLYYGILTQETNNIRYDKNNSDLHSYLFGQALSSLHSCPNPKFKNIKPNTTDPNYLILEIKENQKSPYTQKLKELITMVYNNIIVYHPALDYHMTQCICHGDAWPGNALYTLQSCKLIDLEYARVSDPSFDIATFIWWMTAIENKTQEQFSAWSNFSSGYGRTLETLVNINTPKLIKINQLRNLVFLHNNIILTKEILEYTNNQTLNLLEKLAQPLNKTNLLEALWEK